MTRLVMPLMAIALAGCEVGHLNLAPMSLGPSDAAPRSCLNATADGACKPAGALSSTRATN